MHPQIECERRELEPQDIEDRNASRIQILPTVDILLDSSIIKLKNPESLPIPNNIGFILGLPVPS